MQPQPQKKNKVYNAKVLPLPLEDGGGWLMYFPSLPGCLATGATPEEATKNGSDAAEGWLELANKSGEKIPSSDATAPETWGRIDLSNGNYISLNPDHSKPSTEKEKILTVNKAMKEFLGV